MSGGEGWERRKKIIMASKPKDTNHNIRRRKVPLVAYVDDKRKVIGTAVIEQDFSTEACEVSVVIELLANTPLVNQLGIILTALNRPEVDEGKGET